MRRGGLNGYTSPYLRKPVHVLVDYDNISQIITRKGPRFVADRIQHQLISAAPAAFQGNIRLDIRFYGGWYMTAAHSPRAIQLMAEIQQQFPAIVQDHLQNRRITLNASLAESLLALPHQTLPHTYRKRSGIPKLLCNSPRTMNCAVASCPAGPLNALISSRGCPEAGCTKTIEDFLSRAEQKLVDTMLVSDLIYLANHGSTGVPDLLYRLDC
jgi:hypothetical protein